MNKELQNNEKFIRCAGFIAEMIKKYGSEILEEQKDEENKVSLFVRYIDIRTGAYETRIVNKLSASAAAAGEKERT